MLKRYTGDYRIDSAIVRHPVGSMAIREQLRWVSHGPGATRLFQVDQRMSCIKFECSVRV